MINNQERINIIKRKLEENGGTIPLNISVGVQEKALHIYDVGNIYKKDKTVFLNIVGIPYPAKNGITPYEKKAGDELNIREIKPKSVLRIMWSLLTKEEKAEIALNHLYSDSEYEFLKKVI